MPAVPNGGGESASTSGSGTSVSLRSVSLRRSGIGDVFLSVVSVGAVESVPEAGVSEASVVLRTSVASVVCAGGVAAVLVVFVPAASPPGVVVAAGPACMCHAPVCAPHGEQYAFVTGG